MSGLTLKDIEVNVVQSMYYHRVGDSWGCNINGATVPVNPEDWVKAKPNIIKTDEAEWTILEITQGRLIFRCDGLTINGHIGIFDIGSSMEVIGTRLLATKKLRITVHNAVVDSKSEAVNKMINSFGYSVRIREQVEEAVILI